MRAYIAMSGGVDSSVAAYEVIKQGYEAHGVTLKLLDGEPSQDIADALAVCNKLNIPHEVFAWEDEFRRDVIERWVNTYLEAKTPNPCIFCNKYIKFGKLIDVAVQNGFDKVATGHYAVIEEKDGRFLLKKGLDESKDQSYVLWSLNQYQLSHTLFPLGNMSKAQARALADEMRLETAHKSDSQDICFIDGDYTDYISSFSGKNSPAGNFVDEDGRILGRHKGLIHYTIGQRKGLGLALPAPAYVCRLDTEKNEVVLSDEARLFSNSLTASDVNFIPFDTLEAPLRVMAKVRYRHTAQPATVYPLENGRIRVEFDSAQRAITAGQSVVLYDGDYVVGGGIIE